MTVYTTPLYAYCFGRVITIYNITIGIEPLTILSIRIYITTECKVNASIHNEFTAIQRYRIYS